jgi:diguanylate cyclase (GGDEF)-like protein
LPERKWARRGYALASLGLIVAHPLLPAPGGALAVFVAIAGAAACVAVSRHAVEPARRAPWTLLLWSLGTVAVSAITRLATALLWLVAAIGLSIAAHLVAGLGGATPVAANAAGMIFIGTFTAIGLFGLDPAGPHLVYPHGVSSVERLTGTRLALLGVAIAAIPLVHGVRTLVQGNPAGLIRAGQGALVAAVVMARIGILGAERSRAEQALAHQATHDPLTQLPNRRELLARLHAAISRSYECALMFCDLDKFKAINDQYGHDAGDRLLVEVAQAMRTCVREPHTASRFGGDEFVILLVDVTPAEAETTRQCVTTALDRPFESVDGARLPISTSRTPRANATPNSSLAPRTTPYTRSRPSAEAGPTATHRCRRAVPQARGLVATRITLGGPVGVRHASVVVGGCCPRSTSSVG